MMTLEPTQPELLEIAYNFRAMNTEVELLIYTAETEKAEQACRQVETIFAATEAILSRFRYGSELSKLNREGYLEKATNLLYENVAAAQQMAELTGGIFNPTILDALEAAGYNRSFELIAKTTLTPQLLTTGPRIIGGYSWQQIELDPTRRSIKLPPATRLDLGGIAKGATVDQATRFLHQQNFQNFMLSAGGDMWLSGNPPQAIQGWTVAVQNPLEVGNQEMLTTLVVKDKAVATSATTGRHWWLNNKPRHHLIDPRTGEPTNNGIASVTAVATSVQLADVMAKTALILGPQEAALQLKQVTGLRSLFFVTSEGEKITL